MGKETVVARDGRRPLGPYSTAVRAGGLVFCAGVLGWDYGTDTLAAGGIEAETRQALANLAGTLQDAGCDRGDVVKVTLFVVDLADMAVVNPLYADFFESHPPARTTVQVAGLPVGARLEIEAIAAVPT